MIGTKLRELRTTKGLSLRDLAAETGLSPTLLSQVERGVTEPSLRTLRALALTFGQSISALFEDDLPLLTLVSRPGARSRIASPAGLIQYERLTPGNGQIEVLRGVLEPGEQSSAESWSHPAIECAYVLTGSLTVMVNERPVRVEVGEAVTIDSTQPHRYLNESDSRTEFILSVSPPTP